MAHVTPSRLRNIFYGTDGLRAGWSFLLFVVLCAVLLFLATTITHKIHHPSPSTAKVATVSLTTTFLNESVPLSIILLVTWIMSKIERRPFSVYGLGGNRKPSRLLAGLVWGIIFLSLLVFALWRSGLLIVDGRGIFGTNIVRYAAAWLAAFFLIAFFEEFLFRGYIQYTLTRGLAGLYRWAFDTRHSEALGFWTSAIIWSCGFGFIHKGNPGESPIGLICACLAALMFCVSLWRTGSLWWAIGLHTTWDFAQSFLYGVGDSGLFMRQRLLITHPTGSPLLSGGTTGPEGSIFVLPMIALITVVIFITLTRRTEEYVQGPPCPSTDKPHTSARY